MTHVNNMLKDDSPGHIGFSTVVLVVVMEMIAKSQRMADLSLFEVLQLGKGNRYLHEICHDSIAVYNLFTNY